MKAILERGRNSRSARRWSGKIGQYNMLHVSSLYDRAYDPLLGIIASMLGYQEWWLNMQGVIRKDWGKQVFQFPRDQNDLYEYLEKRNHLGVEYQEGIIIWHIATEVFITKSR